jgi:hypothetical protein
MLYNIDTRTEILIGNEVAVIVNALVEVRSAGPWNRTAPFGKCKQ